MTVFLKTIRVYQWPKNLVVLVALVFAQQFHEPTQVIRSLIALIAFCAASSACYIVNDLLDIENDRKHPVKCKRPLPSGAITARGAITIACLMGAIAAGLSCWLGIPFLAAVAAYVTLVMSYSLALKHQPILDVLILALGFVVRAIAGALALGVAFSNWLVVCTLFLALFLALGKRRNELDSMEDDAHAHRAVLIHYSVPYLDALILIMACSTLLTYTIYTCSPEVVARLGTDKLYITVPFVVYGLFRYLYLIQLHEGGGDPSRTLLQDKPLMATVIAWGGACVAILLVGKSQ